MILFPRPRTPRSRPGRPGWRTRVVAVGIALTTVVLGVFCTVDAEARRPPDAATSIAEIAVSALPREGRETLSAIRAGGPFASKRDGIPFGNREGFLPRQRRGYYAEYTVPTPGERTRGARRIIAGLGRSGDYRSSDEYYYTNDHYQSFRRIVQ